MSKILTAINKTGEYRMHIAVTTDICREASKIHRTSPVATAALGRTLTAATMMSTELKSEEARLGPQRLARGMFFCVFPFNVVYC